MLLPTTTPGRWSILAVGAFAGFLAILALTIAAGQRGGEEFFDNPAGVSAFILGGSRLVGVCFHGFT